MDQTTLFWFPGESKQLFNLYSYFYSFKRKLVISEKKKIKVVSGPSCSLMAVLGGAFKFF